MRSKLAKPILILGIAAVAVLGADNSLGTWKFNAEQSKFTPGPAPVKTLTVTREASGAGVKITVTGEQADGTPINASYSVKYDGKEVQVTGNTPYDTIGMKQVNANTLADERTKTGGQYRATGRTVVAGDGKTMTVTVKGTNAQGQPFTNVMVYDKQ